MARLARERSNSGIYHVMVRGINRQSLFEDDEDRQRLIQTIGVYKSISDYDLYGYCLMNNHIHLLMRETREPITIRQLARITGISKSVIDRVR